MTEVIERYRSCPLEDAGKQIRLLQITYDAKSEAVRYSTTTQWLQEAHKFYAISYTWGDPTLLDRILVNQQSLTVRQNCSAVLKQAQQYLVRQGLDHEYIWIDSICIDQDNLNEKSAQVRIMGDIYQQAECVLICLGSHADGSQLIIDNALHISTLVQRAMPLLPKSHDFFAEKRANPLTAEISSAAELFMSYVRGSTIDDFIGTLLCFGERPYWSRAWILQEVFLAQRAVVLCGDSDVEQFRLRALINVFWAFALGPVPDSILPRLWKHWERVYNLPITRIMWAFTKGERISITDYLRFIGQYHCSDARDRVYSMTRIVEVDKILGPPIPDYTRTVMQVTMQAARHWIPFLKHLGTVDSLVRGLGLNLDGMINAGLAPLPGCTALPVVPKQKCKCADSKSANIGLSLMCSLVYEIHSTSGKMTIDVPENDDQRRRKEILAESHSLRFSLTELDQCPTLVVALCASARAGDLIAELPTYIGDVTTHFVLRPINSTVYEIIGYALPCRASDLAQQGEPLSYQPCYVKFRSPLEILGNTRDSEIGLHFSLEDAILLTGVEGLKDRFERFKFRCCHKRFSTYATMHSKPHESTTESRIMAKYEEETNLRLCESCGGTIEGGNRSEQFVGQGTLQTTTANR